MYKFREDELLEEIQDYITSTYSQHYSNLDGIQTMELISSSGRGMDFDLGNIHKYTDRYGKKNGYNRADLIKVIHYGILALYEHDKEHG